MHTRLTVIDNEVVKTNIAQVDTAHFSPSAVRAPNPDKLYNNRRPTHGIPR
jgi:flagellar basal body rod protein FlgB